MSRWLSPSAVARLTGFSVSFIRAEIKAGLLRATLVRSPSRPRQRGRWRITDADAVEYCARLGFTPLAPPDVTESAVPIDLAPTPAASAV